MSKAKRKMRSQPPWWWTLDNDNCWFCKNRNNCGSCKLLKEQRAIERKKRGVRICETRQIYDQNKSIESRKTK